MSNQNKEPKDIEAQLTLRDRLNYPYYLGDAILTGNKAVLVEDSKQRIVDAIKNFRDLIPISWEDDKFKKDLEDAKLTEKRDIRPLVAGNIKLNEDICKKLGIKTEEEIDTFDYEKLRRACTNLLDRRGMLTKKVYTEWMTGQAYQGEETDIADSEITEL